MLSGWVYLSTNQANARTGTTNRMLIERLQQIDRVRECQAQFNEAFAENLRLRDRTLGRGVGLSDRLIQAVGRAVTDPSSPADRAPLSDLFADYARASDAIKAEAKKFPLRPYPDCGAAAVRK